MDTPLRILLIDDNPNDRLLIIRELSQEFKNIQVDQITDQATFEKRLGEDNFDIVITDYQLCWSDGLSILNAIKSRWRDRPVIMFTGTGDEEIAVKAMKAGLDDYVVKSPKHFVRLPIAVRFVMEKLRQQKAIIDAEIRYRTLFERIPLGLYRTTPDGKILDANPALWHILGYPDRKSLIKVNAKDLYIDPADRDRWQALMDENGSVRNFEVRLRKYDGSIVWVEENSRVVLDKEGQTIYYEGSIEDISERKRIEQDKEKMQEQLLQAQKMEAIGTLAGGIAHDFNNLLTTIQGYTDLAMLKLDKNDPLYRDLKQIHLAALRAAGLTRQLLLFSRKQPMKLVSLNINRVIDDLLKMLNRVIGEDIEIKTFLEPNLWTVKADVGNIEQVIMNLAVNARDAMPSGGTLIIRTENIFLSYEDSKNIPESRPGKFVSISIEDTGIGMEKNILPRIFEPFFSTKEAGKGTGLGLSVVYGIIKQHNGWINVFSEPGKGSTFRVYLPAFSERLEDESQEAVSLQEFQGNGERILLVEDEKGVQSLAKTGLKENGYTVFEASNAKEAVEIFKREEGNFDLIFTDVVLPDTDGLQLIEKLLLYNANLLVLLSSGYTDQKSQWEHIRQKGFQFLQKPYSLYDLLKAVKTVLTY